MDDLKDRRFYTRTLTNEPVNIYVNKKEINCKIRDVSEGGISFELLHYVNIQNGQHLSFQFIDNINKTVQVITGKAVVVRTTLNENSFIIGCTISNETKYIEYVRNKEMINYFEKIHARQSMQ